MAESHSSCSIETLHFSIVIIHIILKVLGKLPQEMQKDFAAQDTIGSLMSCCYCLKDIYT